MIQLIIAAWSMGVIGSFHCIGMCGPIALSLPLSSDNDRGRFFGALFYNAGRVVTYSAFGLLFGLIGKSVAFFGYQQWLSVILGVLIIFILSIPKSVSFFNHANYVQAFFAKIRNALGRLFLKKNYSSLFSIGLLNGLLPCGLIYIAAAAAVSTGDVLNSILFMAFFGLGTLPMMWSVAFFGNYVSIAVRRKIRKIYPYIMMLMACLLILRGMGLGIPYVSPKVDVEKRIVQGCCAKPY
jgi:sulfite exporter TauE/SafE